MAIDRVGTAVNAQIFLSYIQRAENALNETNRQVASGMVSDTYTGYGNQTTALEAARSTAARTEANIKVAQQAATRLDLQDLQLSQFGAIADELRQVLTKAVANNDSSSLMLNLQDLFDQAVTILNAKDGSGYIYAGENSQTPPISVTALTGLAALPGVADAFTNGSVERRATIGENRTIQVGILASDVATEMFTLFRDIALFDQGGSGPFGGGFTPAQDSFMQTAILSSVSVAQGVNIVTAGNGDRYRLVQDTIEKLQAASTVYKGFVADIQDVDIGEALARLSQNQVALQASYQVTSTLNQLSLLNYLP